MLKARRNPFTIELLFFDGEEAVLDWTGTDHTYGSLYYVETAKKAGTLAGLKALILLDMIGDRDLRLRRESNSTRWLTDVIWATAATLGYERYFVNEHFSVGGDDHFEFLAAGIPAVDIIDFEFPAWHTAGDNLDAVSAQNYVAEYKKRSFELLDIREGSRVLEVGCGTAQVTAALQRASPHLSLTASEALREGLVLAGRNAPGAELVQAARGLRPGIRTLLTTGFAEASLRNQAQFADAGDIITKHYRRQDLARKLRSVLGLSS